ncbi:hypothetical protein M9H77_34531 [Catharanthus roseus]|uniref:Uncharacterized protein n=1 Tax=Catharanthus roseus TaxID=4058 RepID=A0ACB9ZMN1_CATRO|nr:hypothetical protein M9H77_34531 [Catharanthus roseus]
MTNIQLGMRDHTITKYNPREGIYMVKSPRRLDGTGNNNDTLKMNEKSCSCGKWQEYTLHCSHALTVCRENGTRLDTYVSDIYLQITYRRTYQSNFFPLSTRTFREMLLTI